MKVLSTRSVLVIAITVLATAVSFGQTAIDTADAFYARLGELKIGGLPSDSELASIAPFLSNEIVTLIKRDRNQQAAFIKRRPGEKPPWIEGDLFSSLFEGRTSYQMGAGRMIGTATHVDVYLEYTDASGTSTWTDTVVLRKVRGKWRITNILYNGDWPFKSGSSLLNVLK